MTSRIQQIQQIEQTWREARWDGITRPYSAAEVVKLRGSVNPAVPWPKTVRTGSGNCLTAERRKVTSTAWAP